MTNYSAQVYRRNQIVAPSEIHNLISAHVPNAYRMRSYQNGAPPETLAALDPFKGLGYLPLLLYCLGRETEPEIQLKVSLVLDFCPADGNTDSVFLARARTPRSMRVADTGYCASFGERGWTPPGCVSSLVRNLESPVSYLSKASGSNFYLYWQSGR